jgi:hypothetical protein
MYGLSPICTYHILPIHFNMCMNIQLVSTYGSWVSILTLMIIFEVPGMF